MQSEKLKVFLMGMLVAFLMVFLLGAKSGGSKAAGRYQMTGDSSGGYIIDTVTGDYKRVTDSGFLIIER